MLACAVPTMSTRKRRGSPIFTFDQLGLPVKKRAREDRNSSQNKPKYGVGMKRDRPVHLLMCPSSNRTRRVASIKAQIAMSSQLKAETPPASPMATSDMYLEDGEEEDKVGRKSPSPPCVSDAGKMMTNGLSGIYSFKKERDEEKAGIDSCSESPSPLSSVDSEWGEEKRESLQIKTPPKLKKAVLSLVPVDCKKAPSKPKPRKPAQPLHNTSRETDSNWYVKRMASLNARACVSVLMESTRRPSKPKVVPSPPAPPARRAVTPPRSVSAGGTKSPPRSSPAHSSCALGQKDSSRHSSADKDDGSDSGSGIFSNGKYVLACASPSTLERYGIIQTIEREAEAPPYNTEGLLWNGDTLHPYTRVYLSPDGSLPQLIVSPVRPAKPSSVHRAVAGTKNQHQRRRKRPRATKEDNGWSVLGEPIKTVMFPQQDGTKVPRKYYIGMKRKDQELYVRDCITVKSGRRKQDRPYVAKIGSIWKEEKGGLMTTLFWYYRPEEATGVQMANFQEDELLASQHYDDNSVACIEEKCFVVGIRQYCRYQAQCKRAAEGVRGRDSFSIVQDSQNEMVQLGLDPSFAETASENPVFLCYRGYNHVAGKLLKTYKH